jgi:hypothetical protein
MTKQYQLRLIFVFVLVCCACFCAKSERQLARRSKINGGRVASATIGVRNENAAMARETLPTRGANSLKISPGSYLVTAMLWLGKRAQVIVR